MFTISHLLENSHLPGPRGNLELLHAFAIQADQDSSRKCLAYIKPDTANGPEEFVGMCGIVSHAVANRTDVAGVLAFLRQALGYGWSVAIAAQPMEGRKAFESFLGASSRHIAWILKENLKKNRLTRMDPEWVAQMRTASGSGGPRQVPVPAVTAG